MIVKHSFLTVLFFLISFLTDAQQLSESNMATAMRSNGKIYVVVAVIAIIFIGIIAYLILLDKKISRIEKQQDKQV